MPTNRDEREEIQDHAEDISDNGDRDQGNDIVDPADTPDMGKYRRKVKCLTDTAGPGEPDNAEK